jgi:hypothetical protein
MKPAAAKPTDTLQSRSIDARTAELAVLAIGVALVAAALLANHRWLDRHFLPSFFLDRPALYAWANLVRTLAGAIGLLLVSVARTRLAILGTFHRAALARIALAAILALGAGELALRAVSLQPIAWLDPADEEPLRQSDPRLGWALVPNRVGYGIRAGQQIEYAFDPSGYRVRSLAESVDPRRPSIVFTGESIMLGYGLPWEDTIPAQVSELLGIQSANLAVNGYSNDQAYMRLQTELPRFQHPIAIVSLFMSSLFGRNLDDDRPHLDPGLVWMPGTPSWRLFWLARFLVPYHSAAAIDRGIGVTREALRATAALARARGAAPLIVVPQFGREDAVERSLRLAVVGAAGIPSVFVEINPAWRLQSDRHPDRRGTHVLAEAIAEALRRSLSEHPPSGPFAARPMQMSKLCPHRNESLRSRLVGRPETPH